MTNRFRHWVRTNLETWLTPRTKFESLLKREPNGGYYYRQKAVSISLPLGIRITLEEKN